MKAAKQVWLSAKNCRADKLIAQPSLSFLNNVHKTGAYCYRASSQDIVFSLVGAFLFMFASKHCLHSTVKKSCSQMLGIKLLNYLM